MRIKTFWPYGIIISILLIVLACIITIIVALKHPVYVDNSYFQSYQEVDENYNDIKASQAIFEKNYKLDFLYKDTKKEDKKIIYLLKANENNEFLIKISSKYNIKDLKIKALLTRAHNTEQDKTLKTSFYKNGIKYILKPTQKGLWQFLIKLSDAKNSAFYRLYLKAD